MTEGTRFLRCVNSFQLIEIAIVNKQTIITYNNFLIDFPIISIEGEVVHLRLMERRKRGD